MRRVSGGRLLKAMLFGIIGVIISLAIEAVVGFLRDDWTNPVGIGLAIVLASVSGVLPLLQQEKAQPAAAAPGSPAYPQAHGYPPMGRASVPGQPHAPGYPPPGYPQSPPGYPQSPAPGWSQSPVQARPPRSRMPAVVAILVLLFVCGGGAGGLAYGTQYLGGWVTGNESGPDILAEEASAAAGDLTVTVHRVLRTAHYTRVEVSAENRGNAPVTLPLYKNCQLTAAGGKTLEGDPFRSDWADTVPSGGLVRGTVSFGPLPAGTTTVSLTFNTVYGRSGGSITVANIHLTPFDS